MQHVELDWYFLIFSAFFCANEFRSACLGFWPVRFLLKTCCVVG